MALAHQLQRYFSRTVRARGQEYVRQRAVVMDRGDAWHLRAYVLGTGKYQVDLVRDRDFHDVSVWCTCPFAGRGEACKHLWAVILTAETQQLLGGDGRRRVSDLHLQPLPTAGRAATGPDDDGDEEDGEDDDSLEDALFADEEDEAADAEPTAWRGMPGPGVRQWNDRQRQDVSARMKAYWEARRAARRGALPAPAPTRAPAPARAPARAPRPVVALWRRRFATFLPAERTVRPAPLPRAGAREILYVLDLPQSGAQGSFVIEIGWRDRKADGEWGRYRTKAWLRDELGGATAPEDERLFTLVTGQPYEPAFGDRSVYAPAVPSPVALRGALVDAVLPDLCAAGRCCLRTSPDEDVFQPLAWDDGPPWELQLDVRPAEDAPTPTAPSPATPTPAAYEPDAPAPEVRAPDSRAPDTSATDSNASDGRTPDGHASSSRSGSDLWAVDAVLVRGDERLPLHDALLLNTTGHLVTPTHVGRFAYRGDLNWVRMLRDGGSLLVPADDLDALFAEIASRPGAPRVSVSGLLGMQIVRAAPRPRLSVRRPGAGRGKDVLHAVPAFDYAGQEVAWDAPADRLFDPGPPRILRERDRQAEAGALRQFTDLGARPLYVIGDPRPVWELKASRLPETVRALLAHGWLVDADGRQHRVATSTRAQVRSGIDWFELAGVVDFGDVSAPIGAVLAALAKGEGVVSLSDGSQGLLPEEWLARQGHWAALGERRGDAVRFARSQAAVLDACLASLPAIDVDAQFEQARGALQAFDGIAPADPPAAFQGTLRGYQREGLGWLQFLERFGFGGCLADDMGLGKTIQVLAALAGRRTDGRAERPSLVVVPRSLVFNWLREAARFAPSLRLIDHTGVDRAQDAAAFDAADLVVTTYGTLRRDAARLTEVQFDYVILDEAHAIKNVDSQTTKAARLLRARHRLALTGTPVQNHLGELWSLFEFLNPGMLGRSAAFARATTGRRADDGARQALARLVRPFILRRTKAAVAPDLPARVEDTIVCRLDREERAIYDRLKAHYRQALASRIARDGWPKARIHVLEALLRLRQAACHPGLIDKAHAGASSAKLDVLLSHLRELREEGHKAIVFSQFVRLLDLVRAALDREGVPYAYLDGRTRDREARVDRFQSDPACPLFLVSLKAGGHGLNLTAAEYVFLLDPWWNPAIEAQAIDRAHRIGQSRAVFAYRLIAEGTIEEKIIALQASKRDLADAILGDDAGALQRLTREDLDLLLS